MTSVSRRTLLAGSILAPASLVLDRIAVTPAEAATPKDVLVVVGEQGTNSLDTMVPVANDYSRFVAWNVYDRLVSHGTKVMANGALGYDVTVMKPELAESWDIQDGGKTIIFHLRKDATFHDGSPVTADDVKWSFDRAVTVGGFATIQMGAGSMVKPEQFSVVDPHTFKMTFDEPNKLTMPDLVVPIPVIVNSKLALKHATTSDPWALDWVQHNDAGGGGFKVASWAPGTEIVFTRFDDWKSGPLPKLKRVIYRQIPSAGTRRALLERGDVDISVGLPPRDYSELAKAGKLQVIGTPVQNDLLFVDMNVKMKPFDNLKVRQAMAWAIPYQSIMDSALYNRDVAMWGGDPSKPYPPEWPVVSPYKQDLTKAKQLLTEAGYPNGFSTTLSYDLSQATTREPIALFMQEALAKIGVTVTLNKVPGANWFAQMAAKTMPFVITEFYGWLVPEEYFYYWNFYGKNDAVFNTANYQNPKLDAVIEAARFESDKTKYDADLVEMNDIVMADLPRIPLARVFFDIAMQKNVKNYVYWFHTHPDFRVMYKE
jgi:peptide/nickel transport system substrate-binding protein